MRYQPGELVSAVQCEFSETRAHSGKAVELRIRSTSNLTREYTSDGGATRQLLQGGAQGKSEPNGSAMYTDSTELMCDAVYSSCVGQQIHWRLIHRYATRLVKVAPNCTLELGATALSQSCRTRMCSFAASRVATKALSCGCLSIET